MSHEKFYGICENKCFVEINADSVGAAAKSHTHSLDDMTTGILPVERGGTGGSTADEVRRKLDVMHRAWLYENSAGTTGTITLYDSSFNYKFIEIFFRTGAYFRGSVMLQMDGEQIISGMHFVNPTSGFAYVDARTIVINGTSITNGETGHFGIENGSNYSNNGNNIYITRVIGYSY